MALTTSEENVLVDLFGKAEWPLSAPVFHALLGKTISVPLELCIVDQDGLNILLFGRVDHEFNAILGPGTVLRDTDNDPSLGNPINRLLGGELVHYQITYPKNIGWVHVPRGTGQFENRTRHEISLVFLSRLTSVLGEGGKGVLYPLDTLPDRLIGYHRVMIDKVIQYLRDSKPILG